MDLRTVMLKKLLLVVGIFFINIAQAQLIQLVPADATGDDELTLIFDASEASSTALVGASSVYMHSGVVTSGPDGTSWEYVKGNWGADDGIGKMTKVEGESNKWQITFTPREYYGVPEDDNIFRLSMVFRNEIGSAEAKGIPGTYDWGFIASNGDIYVDLNVESYVNILSPAESSVILSEGETLTIEAESSAEVSQMNLLINDVEKASVTSGNFISYEYATNASEEIVITVNAVINGTEAQQSKTVDILFKPEATVVALPEGVIKGINYHDDETTVTLVLEAPGKEFAYVVGDFTNWERQDNYLMNQTPDGELFWLEITGLTPGQQYVFQYWIDGSIKVGDPYAELVADPWNDQYIPSEIHPSIPEYSKTEYGIATILQTGQEEYVWSASEDTWSPPRKDELVIYELLVRDFLGSHSYKDLTDTLSYLKTLGINAIELMPVMEFEGNISWGYNPSYFFAPDKYYGTKEDLKKFIETAHQQGIAVILDMVLNHAFGQNAMVQMYWDQSNNTVSSDNPWFNPIAKHPFNVGLDFNHESSYTKDFADSVNRYWIEEFHFDGYRFDLSKGFTQTYSGEDVGYWGNYDQSRIDLIKRMANNIWSYDPDAYVILEHFADANEEAVLAAEGMLLWRNINHPYSDALKGNGGNISGANAKTHVSYMESHDEQRQAYEMKTNGSASGSYNTKDKLVALERLKMAAAFHLLQSGPKMIWQFGELGYDIDINYIDRLAEKPLPWGEGNLGYYEDEFRQYVYDAYAALLKLRNDYPLVIRTGSFAGSLNEPLKRFSLAHPTLNINVIGNFGLEEGNINPNFPSTGIWYDYFSGEEINITNQTAEIPLKPGEFHVYTNKKVSEGFPGVVQAYSNPVTVDPPVFKLSDQIKITFDATLSSPDGTDGLVGAEKVYIHAGIVTEGPDGTELENVVGNLADDGVGQMSKVSGSSDNWEITITPQDYFSVQEGINVFRIGMYFRDATNDNIGKGYRDQLIYLDVIQEGNLVSVEPAEFSVEDEITITFNAALGNRGLLDANKIYMHSGVVTTDIAQPTGNNWTNVVGTWGVDDGVGELTKVEGTDNWQITLTPQEYYNISGEAYWLAMVFRNENGAAKGTGSSGEFEGGFIDQNGDIYVAIPKRKGTVTGISLETKDVIIYPNPTSGMIYVPARTDERKVCSFYNMQGQMLLSTEITGEGVLDVSPYEEGMYLLLIATESTLLKTKVIIKK